MKIEVSKSLDECILGDSGYIVGFYLSGVDLELNNCNLK